jgi:ribosomal protein S12 methylthiotransferase accessory factor
MEMVIDFPGGARVDAHFGPFNVSTDQPSAGGGEGAEPTPFELFLASIATCAGIFVLTFCRKRGISTDGIRIVQRTHHSLVTGLIQKIDLESQVPPSFPKNITARSSGQRSYAM